MSPEIIHHPAAYIAFYVGGLATGAIALPGALWIADRLSEWFNREA